MIPARALLFWDVDTQVDFMEPGGKLYVPGAENIIPKIQHLNSWAAAHGMQVISSMDAHLVTDPEFQEYPPHCLAGTPGQKKVPGTMLPNHFVVPNRAIELPDKVSSFEQIIVEKQATDVFTNPNIAELVRRVAFGKEVVLYGVVTEICVDKAARGLIKGGHRVHIVGDAIQHLDESAAKGTIQEILRSGGRVLTTEEIVTSSSGAAKNRFLAS
jgi:nicotinamidase/pyrazinamidase